MKKLISKTDEIKAENINWVEFGSKIQQIRLSKHLSISEAANELEIQENNLLGIERGAERKSVNIVWLFVNKWDLSINWLLNDIGSPDSEDPAVLLPKTLLIEKGAGIRRSEMRVSAEEGTFGEEILEFILAIDHFKAKNNVQFPSLSQIYEITRALGYRKTASARIAPLGHIVKQDKHKPQPRHFLLRSPDGVEFVTPCGLELFCEEQEIPVAEIKKVISGQLESYNGWTSSPLGNIL